MLDRVREAMFSTLQGWMRDAVVLDLFAGSGSLGLEALSRGASRVRLVERGQSALVVLRKNVGALGVRDRVEIVVGDALKPATWLPGVDVAFVDPPYALLDDERGRVLGAVGRLASECLAPEGIAVLHVPRGALTDAELPVGARVRRYGTNDLWYLRPPAPS